MFSSVVEGVTTCEFFVDNNQHTWFYGGGLPLLSEATLRTLMQKTRNTVPSLISCVPSLKSS